MSAVGSTESLWPDEVGMGTISLKKLNKNQIKIVVSLDQEELRKYLEKAEDMLGGELEIKGFRKGKAPKDLVRNHIGQERVNALALEIALEESLADIIKNNSLDVLETSQLAIEENNAAQLKYSVLADLFPQVELADLNRIKVKRHDIEIEEKDIENALDMIKNSRASFIDKSGDEPAENGDRVEVDFEVRKDGKIIDGGVSKNHPLIIGDRILFPVLRIK